MALAGVAIIALSMPALAMDQQSGTNNGSDAAQNSAAQKNPAQNSGQDLNSGGSGAAMQPNSSPSEQSAALSPDKLNKDVIRNVQQALNKKGFDAGRVDGIWGHETVAAIKNFQERNDLKADGKLDHQTMAALGLSSGQEPTTTGSGAGRPVSIARRSSGACDWSSRAPPPARSSTAMPAAMSHSRGRPSSAPAQLPRAT
jgi:peptidoglycan hydrolase-like protein with peptidoglycan-binding domain